MHAPQRGDRRKKRASKRSNITRITTPMAHIARVWPRLRCDARLNTMRARFLIVRMRNADEKSPGRSRVQREIKKKIQRSRKISCEM
jgi:hypothetical protein